MYHLRRLFVLLILMVLFSLCVASLGIVDASKFSMLLLAPILILSIGGYFLGKSLMAKGSYSNLLAVSIPALMFFVFVFLGSVFDPRNKTPLGWNTFLLSGAAGLVVLLLGLLVITIQMLLKKQ